MRYSGCILDTFSITSADLIRISGLSLLIPLKTSPKSSGSLSISDITSWASPIDRKSPPRSLFKNITHDLFPTCFFKITIDRAASTNPIIKSNICNGIMKSNIIH